MRMRDFQRGGKAGKQQEFLRGAAFAMSADELDCGSGN